MNWYAIWTRYRHEDLVKMQLNKKNLEVFLPKIKTLSKRRDRRKMIEKPLFPGYLFTRTELNPKSYLKIIRCQGV
ncbi:transcriptional antiterminator, partial [candidate division WOR-3 bacterium]|nr:transcriptional antiterminator [candidate division WOR-3 bacterium]